MNVQVRDRTVNYGFIKESVWLELTKQRHNVVGVGGIFSISVPLHQGTLRTAVATPEAARQGVWPAWLVVLGLI